MGRRHDIRQGEQRNVEVSLIGGVSRRFPDAELRYRQTYIVSEGSTTSGPTVSDDTPTVTRRNPSSDGRVFGGPSPSTDSTDEPPKMKRRPMVDEPGTSRKVDIVTGSVEKAAEKAEVKTVEAAKPADPPPATGGFRRLKPGEKP